MSIRKTGAATGHITGAAEDELPFGIDEEGHVVTARLSGMTTGQPTWGKHDEQALGDENDEADGGPSRM